MQKTKLLQKEVLYSKVKNFYPNFDQGQDADVSRLIDEVLAKNEYVNDGD